jgi:hypothetical protein
MESGVSSVEPVSQWCALLLIWSAHAKPSNCGVTYVNNVAAVLDANKVTIAANGAIEPLVDLLRSPIDRVRLSAAGALRNMSCTSTFPSTTRVLAAIMMGKCTAAWFESACAYYY